MEDQFKFMDKKLETYNQRQDLQNKKVEDTLVRLAQSLDEIRNQLKGSSSTQRIGGDESNKTNTDQAFFPETGNNRSFKFAPKLDFPKFDGVNPRVWIKKCNRYFELCKISNDQKVDLASLYMIDKAEIWVTSYLAVRKFVEWDDFIIDLVARFRDYGSSKIVEQFNRLQQFGQLEDYVDEFESARSLMLQHNHMLPDAYILDSFIGGLKATVKPFVKAFKPTTIAEAIDYARLKEESLNASYKSVRTSSFSGNHQPKPIQSVPLLANTNPPLLPTP